MSTTDYRAANFPGKNDQGDNSSVHDLPEYQMEASLRITRLSYRLAAGFFLSNTIGGGI